MTDRKKPGVAFWATVVLVVVLLYVASFGPVCWFTSRANLGDNGLFTTAYRPITSLFNICPKPVRRAIRWYSHLCAADHWIWVRTKATRRWNWEKAGSVGGGNGWFGWVTDDEE